MCFLTRALALWILWVGMMAFVAAQDRGGSDSLLLDNRLAYRQQVIMHSLAFIAADTVSKYGVASLRQAAQWGDLRRAQQAYHHRSTSFHTQGHSTIGRFKLSGDFFFDRVWEDSLAYLLAGEQSDLTAHYFFAGKPGQFLRQNFSIRTGVSYEVLPDKLLAGIAMDYHSHNSARNVDPRPKANSFDVKLNPELIYRIDSKHQLAVEGRWGTGDESIDIAYKSKLFSLSIMYPERNYFVNYGYGFIAKRPEIPLYRLREYSGVGLSYQGDLGSEIELLGTFRYDYSKEYNALRNYDIRRQAIGAFDTDQVRGDLLFSRSRGSSKQQLALSGDYATTIDFSKLFMKSNYTAMQTGFYGHYLIGWGGQSWTPELGAALSYTSGEKKDYAAAHRFSFRQITPSISVYGYRKRANADLKMGMSVGCTFPQTSFDVPEFQVNEFTRGVAYPDYYYYSNTTWQIRPSVHYVSRSWLKNMGFGLFLSADYRASLRRSAADYDATFRPHGYRLQIDGGVQILL